jgi:hypothetical protein
VSWNPGFYHIIILRIQLQLEFLSPHSCAYQGVTDEKGDNDSTSQFGNTNFEEIELSD